MPTKTNGGDHDDGDDIPSVALSVGVQQHQQHLVGLCPYFWAHVPLSIRQVHSLVLMNGLHCLAVDKETTATTNTRTTTETNTTEMKTLVPLSKCRLVGTIVAVDRRGGNGGTIYVIDDGTAVIDCLSWGDGDDEDGLWDLVDKQDYTTYTTTTTKSLHVGQLVRVYGRIDSACLVLHPTACTSAGSGGGAHSQHSSSLQQSFELRRTCLHEIRATMIHPLASSLLEMNASTPWQAEMHHWKEVQDFVHCLQKQQQTHHSMRKRKKQQMYWDVPHILDFLGCKIREQIQDLHPMPNNHEQHPRLCGKKQKKDRDEDGSNDWQLFGAQCHCQMEYKSILLYCHCIATPLPSSLPPPSEQQQTVRDNLHGETSSRSTAASNTAGDPNFVYRDALLSKLVQMEAATAAETQQQDTITRVEPLRFQYFAVVKDPTLLQVSQQVQQQHGMKDTYGHDLALNTFRALRTDGILYLLDGASDTYVLLSRKRALESYLLPLLLCRNTGLQQPGIETTEDLRSSNNHHNNNNNNILRRDHPNKPPIYWSYIPKARIHFVKRQLLRRIDNGEFDTLLV